MNSSRLGDKDAIQVPGTMGATSKTIAGFRQIWILSLIVGISHKMAAAGALPFCLPSNYARGA
jgi:hypothetical protein